MSYDDDMKRCWGLNACHQCLHKKAPRCVWCPYSNACVAAPRNALFGSPLLSPISNPLVCPERSERWEVRSRGLGCNVSTRTFLSTSIGVFSTLFLVAMTMAIVWTMRSGVLQHLKRIGGEESGMPWNSEDGESVRWRRGLLLWSPPRRSSASSHGERRPLLGQGGDGVRWWNKGWFNGERAGATPPPAAASSPERHRH
ncbi:hypothetical protein BJ508DRAFT_414988 [Ascobolus immersus RN42]|uniref:PSI domain-containing protein n=1 Tax=Ascobolus immersus RN42 TaxID=1160509 RepID=A0A3N4IHM0_ASCIM|nr:hypothetical protein BJ508DRAFT_414988 [Ascobolus immersus RN42]